MITPEQLAARLDKLESKIDNLQNTVNRGKGAVSLLAWLGGITAVILGFLNR
tara:strand:+ start:907 stop:1062 length:156 start_codon:yes stop_codon:yes gene_type:complete